MKKMLFFITLTTCLTTTGCITGASHRADIQDNATDKISVANIQREIHVGMSGAEVISILGAPNMVTTDSERREVWVYDKVATEKVYSTSQGGIGLLFLGGYEKNAGAASTSQRTLTIIIKFDKNNMVRDYSYRQSSF